MIQITIKDNEFAYDMTAFAQVFYPEKKCTVTERPQWLEREGYTVSWEIDGVVCYEDFLPYPYTKGEVKQRVYDFLCRHTGKSLPWGTLTGVRPAKIPLRMLMDGRKEEEIWRILREEYRCGPDKTKLVMDVAKREYALTGKTDHENSINIYIGIPFCPSICAYCSFSSYPVGKYEGKTGAYLDALEKELAYAKEAVRGKTLQTVYIGGGTPTALPGEAFERLLGMVERYLPMDGVKEYTVEAGRPDSMTEGKLRCMKDHRVSRISVNPQSMKQHTLDLLGRRHTVSDVKRKYALARELGFDNINMDLIAGLPEETLADFEHTLRETAQMEPDSITVHTLVIKRASQMRREQMERGGALKEENLRVSGMQHMAEEFCREHGYEPYYMYRQKNKALTTRNTNQENVAYARPGKECLYNVFMMEELETILALGSGGSSKYVYPRENRMERVENVKSIDHYIDRIDEMIERKRKFPF